MRSYFYKKKQFYLNIYSEKLNIFYNFPNNYYMDICIGVRFMDKCNLIMAIPIYVPEGIGPIDGNNNSRNNNNFVELTELQQVHLVNPAIQSDNRSFLHQLGLELYHFYTTYMMGNQNQQAATNSSSPSTYSQGNYSHVYHLC